MSDLWQEVAGWSFWSAFWPNFAATLVGAAAGIPSGLWIAGRQQRDSQKRQADDRKARLGAITALLREALDANAKELERIAAVLAKRDVPAVTTLRLEVWTVLRVDALQLIDDRRLQADLATHFEASERLERQVAEQVYRALSRLGNEPRGEAAQQVTQMESVVASSTVTSARREAEVARELSTRLQPFTAGA